MALIAKALAIGSAFAGALAEWKPVDEVKALNLVEDALHKVEEAKLTPEQHKLSMRTVQDVEQVISQLKTNQSLTKVQRGQKVKSAILELQGLQSQWELAAVEGSLKKVLQTPNLSPEQLKSARKVVGDVDAVVEAIEAGTLKGEAKAAKVAFTIKELSGLQQAWANSSAPQAEMAKKRMLLKEDEMKLQLAKLEKELLEKKAEMRGLQAGKEQAEDLKKEDAAQHDMIGKLMASAKVLVASNASLAAKAVGNSTSLAGIGAIVANLKAKAQNMTETLSKMDAAEAKREKQWAPKDSKVMKRLHKKMSRSFKQVRAMKAAELRELKQAIGSIERGDMAALQKVMAQMQSETKALDAKTKNFLY